MEVPVIFYVKMFMDMDWAFKTYSSWIDHVKHRSDLTYVLDILEEKLHTFVGGGLS
jgi:hypothetical protein